MSLEELRDVIEKPAVLPDVQISFEAGLVGDLLFEVRGEGGALPLLQFTLDQLFRQREGHRLTYAAYRDLGGVRGALAQHAEEVFNGLPSEVHQRLARALFLRLIDPGTTEQEVTRRRAPLTELALADPDRNRIIREVVDSFVQQRLLTTSKIGQTNTIEVSHEALIREWDRLGEWLRAARDDIRLQQATSADTAAWIRAGRPPDSDMLYRGTVLTDAENWAKRNLPSEDETAFLQAALAAELARKKREAAIARRVQNFGRAAAILAGVGLLALVVTIVAVNQAARANDQVRDAYVRVVTAQAQMMLIGSTLTPVAQTLTPMRPTLDSLQATQTVISKHTEPLQLIISAENILQTDGGDPRLAALLAIRALKISYSPDGDLTLSRATKRLISRRLLAGHQSNINCAAFSPNGRIALTGSDDMTVRLWDVQSGQLLRQVSSSSQVLDCTFSPDGKMILAATYDAARLWDTQTGTEIRQFAIQGSDQTTGRINQAAWLRPRTHPGVTLDGSSGDITRVAFSPDGKYVLTGGSSFSIYLWDAQTGKQLREFTEETEQANPVFKMAPDFDSRSYHAGGGVGSRGSVGFSPDGKTVLATADNEVLTWDTQTGSLQHHITGNGDQLTSASFSPDGKYVLTSSIDSTARLFDAQTGVQIQQFNGHVGGVYMATFSPDGKTILTGGRDSTVRLWDIQTGKELRRFTGHSQSVGSVAFSPDGQTLLSGSWDMTARLWDAQVDYTTWRVFAGQNSVSFSRDNTMILAISDDNTVRLWNAQTGKEQQRFTDDSAAFRSAVFSPDGKTVLTGSEFTRDEDRQIRLWDVQTGKELRRFIGPLSGVVSVAFSHDGQYALTGGLDGAFGWDVQTGAALRQFPVSETGSNVDAVAFSSDRKRILIANQQKITVWDGLFGALLAEFDSDTRITSAALSPDGNEVAISDSHGTSIWNTQSRKLLQQYPAGVVSRSTFSPDGQYLLSGGDDQSVRLWDMSTGRQLRQYADMLVPITGISFSSDGKYVLIGRGNNTVQLWDTLLQDSIALTCSYLSADLEDWERTNYGINDGAPTCEQTPGPTATPTSTLPVWTPLPSPSPDASLATRIQQAHDQATFLPGLPMTSTWAIVGGQTATALAQSNATALYRLEQTRAGSPMTPAPTATPDFVMPTSYR